MITNKELKSAYCYLHIVKEYLQKDIDKFEQDIEKINSLLNKISSCIDFEYAIDNDCVIDESDYIIEGELGEYVEGGDI